MLRKSLNCTLVSSQARHALRLFSSSSPASLDLISEDQQEKWWRQVEQVAWTQKPTQLFEAGSVQGRYQWFKDGALNLCYNLVDVHLETRGD